jgi:ElaB/YqjD/DUF883 family membrane-anchored ribosome-binding protein
MTYVPSVRSSSSPPSPRARELAAQLERVIRDFQSSYPDTKPADVQQAVEIAWGGPTSSTLRSRRLLAVGVAAGLAALFGVFVAMRESGELPLDMDPSAVAWIVGGLLVLMVLIRAARR